MAGLAGLGMIVAGLILGAGCEPMVENSAAPVTVTITNASPGVYVNTGDGSTITIGDGNQVGIAPDMSTDNSVRSEGK